MGITVRCPACGARCTTGSSQIGEKVTCGGCRASFEVADPNGSTIAAPPKLPRREYAADSSPASGESSFVKGLGVTLGVVTAVCLALMGGAFLVCGGCFGFGALAALLNRDSQGRNESRPQPAILESHAPAVIDKTADGYTILDISNGDAELDAEKKEAGEDHGIVVCVVGGWLAKVAYFTPGMDVRHTSERHILLRVRVNNETEAAKVDFPGWSALGHLARLRDGVGNKYRQIDFGFGNTVPGQTHDQAIYPGKYADDSLVFESPVGAAKSFILELPMQAVHRKHMLAFRFPRSFLKDGEQKP